MTRILAIASAIAAACVSVAQAGFGTAYNLYMPQPYATYITRYSVSLTVPPVPNPQENILALWPGLNTGDVLYQPILNSAANPLGIGCPAKAGQWCAFAYYLVNGSQVHQQTNVAVSPGTKLNYTIQYIGNNQGYNQSVSKDGSVISSYKTGVAESKHGNIVYLEVECQQNAKGVTPAHTYTNLTIVLAAKTPNFGSTVIHQANAATASNLYTTDGGTTWKIDTINMTASTCNPNSQAGRVKDDTVFVAPN